MQPSNTIEDSMANPTKDTLTAEMRSPSLPLAISLPILLVVAILWFLILNYVFPIFVIADELLGQQPPDPIAVAREKAFSRARLTNSLLAFATIAFVVATVWPVSLVLMKRIPSIGIRYLMPVALVSVLIACLGVVFGHLVMELTNPQTLGITRTFLGHWLVFGFFGLAIGFAMGVAMGGRKLVGKACERGIMTGLISATIFDLLSAVSPRSQIDSLFPGGVLWGGRDPWVVAAWIGLLLLPLAFGLRNVRNSSVKSAGVPS